MSPRRDTFPVHGIGYQPVTPELREALRRYVATHTKREVERNLGSEDMVHRVIDMGTATRRVAARLAAVLGCAKEAP